MKLARSDAADLPFSMAPVCRLAEMTEQDLPHGARPSTVTSAADFASLEKPWRKLEGLAPAATVFQTFDWLDA